jgi:hypothetical protein
VESHKIDGRVVRRVLGTLGRRDELPAHKIDGLIEHLRKLASPQGLRGIGLGEVEIRAVREYGVALVAHHVWRQLGLDRLLAAIPQRPGAPVSEAVFRMVVNRLCDPHSKLGLVDWTDERGNLHRGWQGQVQWPSASADLNHTQYLRAMDHLHPHRQQLEDQLFARVTDLLSLNTADLGSVLRVCDLKWLQELPAGQWRRMLAGCGRAIALGSVPALMEQLRPPN